MGDATGAASSQLTYHTRSTCTYCGPVFSTPMFMKLNPHLQIRFSPVSVTTQCTELSPRYAQYFGHNFNSIFAKLYKNVQEESGTALAMGNNSLW